MQFQMRSLLRIWLPLILLIALVYYYYSTFLWSPRPTLLVPVSVTLPPSQYKIVEMNDRTPHFKLATINGHKPYADGDKAQATIINSLQLVSKCKQDPSLIVVDVGGFLGSYTLYLKNKHEITK